MTATRTWLALGAGALFAATAATTAAAQNRASGSGIRVTKDRSAASTSTTASSATATTTQPTTTRIDSVSRGSSAIGIAPFPLAPYANMSDQNITAHLASGDSLEIRMAQLAQGKATSQTVRDYAAMLQSDHTAHLAQTIHVINDGVGAQPMASDPEGLSMQQELSHLQMMPAGAGWDAMFLRFQVQHHQNEIDLLSAKRAGVRSEDLGDHLGTTVTALTKHRDAGRSVASGLGLTL